MKSPKTLFKKQMEECNWRKSVEDILIKFYDSAGKPAQYWINYFVEENHLEESVDDSRILLRSFFINFINNTYNKFVRIDNSTGFKSTLHERFKFCCDNNFIPSIATIEGGKTVVIFSSIMNRQWIDIPNSIVVSY